MAHFAFIAPPLRGHFDPLCHLASELTARGHKATFVHHSDARPLVDAQAAAFEPIGADSLSIETWVRPMARIRGTLGLGGVINGMTRFTDMFCREAPSLLRGIGADALIVDQLEAGGGLVAEHLGLPWASVANALPINRELGVPPPYVGWRYRDDPKGLSRNRGGWRVTDFLMRGVGKAIEHNAAVLGLPPRRRLEDCFSPLLQLSQMVAGLDFPRAELPVSFHYTGPFRSARPGPFTLPPGDDRPLVYCSLGTLQGSRTSIFHKVAEACHRLNLRLLVSRGGGGAELSLPGDPLVYDWVDQMAVLRQADMVVCHGGMNTVLDALAAGLPMVIVPLAFEQSAIAARAEHAGVARVVNARSSDATFAKAIADVRSNSSLRNAARRLQQEIAQAGGTARAADLIESRLL